MCLIDRLIAERTTKRPYSIEYCSHRGQLRRAHISATALVLPATWLQCCNAFWILEYVAWHAIWINWLSAWTTPTTTPTTPTATSPMRIEKKTHKNGAAPVLNNNGLSFRLWHKSPAHNRFFCCYSAPIDCRLVHQSKWLSIKMTSLNRRDLSLCLSIKCDVMFKNRSKRNGA